MPKTRITGVIFENVARFAGSYPDIPIAESVLNELGENAVFLTLPIGFSDAESRNGRKYSAETAKAIMDAVNTQKSVGQKGHIRTEDRPYSFDIPPLMWIAAKEVDGTIWGKAYVMQHASDVREYIKVAKVNNARIGTSIYGLAEVDEDGNVSNLEIESIDLAHPARLGITKAAAVPVVTSESMDDMTELPETAALARRLNNAIDAMVTDEMPRADIIQNLADAASIEPGTVNQILNNEITRPPRERLQGFARVLKISADELMRLAGWDDTSEMEKEGANVPEDKDKKEDVQESTVIQELRREHREAVRELNTQIAELQEQLADFNSMLGLLKVAEGTDPVTTLRARLGELDALKKENAELLDAEIRARVEEKVKVPDLVPIICGMVKQHRPVRKVDVETARDEVLANEDVKTLLKMRVKEQAGPNQQRPAQESREDHTDAEFELGFAL